MKLPITFLAILSLLGLTTSARAQLIESQNFGSTSNPGSYSTTVTTTVAEPLILQLGVEFNTSTDETNQPPSAPNITIQIDQQAAFEVPAEAYVVTPHPTDGNNGQVYTTDISTLNYTTGTLPPGNHTITITFPSYFDSGENWPPGTPDFSGGYTIIAPDEPPTGLAQAEASLQSAIDAVQADEQTDAGNISTLQANVAQNASNISALQTAETDDEAVIATLQAQLQTIQDTLQSEINTNSAAITALQTSVTADEATIAQDESQISTLQNQAGNNSTTITTLQQQEAATETQQQNDEASLATLQSQQTQIQTELGNLQTQLATDETAQATENVTLQNQITALQNGLATDSGLPGQVNSLNNSESLTRTLTYAGLGLGVAGIGTGIGAILSSDSDSGDSGNATPSDTQTDSNGVQYQKP